MNYEELKYFKYDHLPSHLQTYSKPFYDVAFWMLQTIPDTEQRRISLQKLLEAKDCAVRAAL